MTNRLKKYYKWVLGASLGAAAGFAYWYFIGCSSGSCPITSNPYNTMGYFALVGLLLVPNKKRDGSKKENHDE